jgi:hypothetical protein
MAKWIHVGHYSVGPEELPRAIVQTENPAPVPQKALGCEDLETNCNAWSMRGGWGSVCVCVPCGCSGSSSSAAVVWCGVIVLFGVFW